MQPFIYRGIVVNGRYRGTTVGGGGGDGGCGNSSTAKVGDAK